jgi:hypothetical protein
MSAACCVWCDLSNELRSHNVAAAGGGGFEDGDDELPVACASSHACAIPRHIISTAWPCTHISEL